MGSRSASPLHTLVAALLVLAVGLINVEVRARAQSSAQKPTALRIVVVEGEDAVNIIQQRTAVSPIVEVRDDNDLPVAGVLLRFRVSGGRAVFGGGLDSVTLTTNAAGRATVSGLQPLQNGAYQIEVTAIYQGQTAQATITQHNFATVGDATKAGRKVQSGQSGATGGVSGGTAVGAAVGGGLSKLAVLGIIAGGAAGAAVAVSAAGRNAETATAPTPTFTVSASQTAGLQAATPFTFSVQAANFEAGALTYRWEFGDGGISTDAAPTYIYSSPGTYTVVVTVSNARQSARSESSVTVHTVTGRWVEGGTLTTTLQLTQSGSGISGEGSIGSWTGCVLTGSVEVGVPAVILLHLPACPHPKVSSINKIYKSSCQVYIDA